MMGCFGECWDLGPPPDSILYIPPPPAPEFLQPSLPDLLLNTTPCSSTQVCEALIGHIQGSNGGEYVELPRKDLEATTWSVPGIDDTTWLFILIVSSIGVLLFGALLAMFLLKCREMNILGGNECTIVHTRDHRQAKNPEARDCSALGGMHQSANKIQHPSEAVLYAGTPPNLHDNRVVWAALTPHGTQHFVSENYPRNLIDYEPEDHYETVDHSVSTVTYQKGAERIGPLEPSVRHARTGIENSGFVDYDYEDPAPLIESYQLNNMDHREEPYYTSLDNPDMRCASLGYRRVAPPRPRVSPPTRIEHPNLPPLNLYPHKGASMTLSLKRSNLPYRNPENGTYRTNDNLLPKYGC